MIDNYYEILGLTSDCSQDDIKKAFRSAAMKHHPDRGGDQDRFKEINSAYEVLNDPVRRAEYDRMKQGRHSFQFNGEFPFDEFFVNINPFDNLFRSRMRRNKDLNIHCTISLYDSYVGKQVEATFNLPNGNPQKIKIDIPAGINHGSNIRYNGLGDDAISGVPRGNLNVTIIIAPDPIFNREHDNLCTTVDINPIEAIIGCNKEIKSITGETINLTIKPGTETGVEYAIKEQGFHNLQTGKRGRFVARIKIKTPKITDKNLIEKLKQLNSELNGY